MSARVSVQGWCVYILKCGDGTLYTGCTNDLARRLARHGAGKGAAYTRSRLPVKLVFQEPARDRSAALRREFALKRLARAQKLALIREAATLAPRVRPRAPQRVAGGLTAGGRVPLRRPRSQAAHP